MICSVVVFPDLLPFLHSFHLVPPSFVHLFVPSWRLRLVLLPCTRRFRFLARKFTECPANLWYVERRVSSLHVLVSWFFFFNQDDAMKMNAAVVSQHIPSTLCHQGGGHMGQVNDTVSVALLPHHSPVVDTYKIGWHKGSSWNPCLFVGLFPHCRPLTLKPQQNTMFSSSCLKSLSHSCESIFSSHGYMLTTIKGTGFVLWQIVPKKCHCSILTYPIPQSTGYATHGWQVYSVSC